MYLVSILLRLNEMTGRGRGEAGGVVNYIEDAPQAGNPAVRQEHRQDSGSA